MHKKKIAIIGAGLAGSEAAIQLANRNYHVVLFEMRPCVPTSVHKTTQCAELVCSNSLKGTKPESAAGMLKYELDTLGSILYNIALKHKIPAGGALAVNRDTFASEVTKTIENHPLIELRRHEITSLNECAKGYDAVIIATGPLTSPALSADLLKITGQHLSFFDAAAPIVEADSLDYDILFRQSRYEDAQEGRGDYLNAPFTKDEYEYFIEALIAADRVILKDFESKDLFQACQPIEEIARKGVDAPRFGPLKPVGLIDPRTGKRPWAVVQLRAENRINTCYNLVGFQTNLTFKEQKRVFSLIPGLQNAIFSRYGVMHKNTFINAPRLLDTYSCFKKSSHSSFDIPLYFAGQVSGTEGYCEAIRSGLYVAHNLDARFKQIDPPLLPTTTVFGALIDYATNESTRHYQPMHVNFGIIAPLEKRIKNKGERYKHFMLRGQNDIDTYKSRLVSLGIIEDQ